MRRLVVGLATMLLCLAVAASTVADPPSVPQPVPQALFRPVVPPVAIPTALPVIVTTPRPTARPRPAARVVVTPRPSPRPMAHPAPRYHVDGVATWYCQPGVSICTAGYPASGAYGAAGPALRAALGNWRGRTVYVNGIAVLLVDWCQCNGDHVIDVYHATWVTIPHPDSVEVRW